MILWRQRRHCLLRYPEQGKARREEGGKHLCHGLTSWKRIKSSCTTKKVLKKIFSLTEMHGTGYLEEKRAPATKCAKQHLLNLCLQKDTWPASFSWAFPQPSSVLPTRASRQLLHISQSKTQGIKNLLCILMHSTIRASSQNKQRNS